MNDTTFYWIAEVLGKGAGWLGVCLLVSPWGARRGRRVWRVGWLVLGVMAVLSLGPSVWHWTWAEPTRRVMASVEASLAPVVGVEPEGAVETVAAAVRVGTPAESVAQGRPAWSVRQWLVAGWLTGVAATGGWLAWGFGVAARWRREAVALDDPSWREILAKEAAAAGLVRPPELAVHPRAPGPCVVGIGRRRTIVLPPESLEWDAETRRSVVCHELAHLSGQDGPFAVYRSLVLALHWPNPLAWMAATRDIREQELAADRRVLASGVDAGAYASLLLNLARRRPGGLVPAASHPMATLSSLEGRFRGILGQTAAAAAPTWWRRGLTAIAAVGVAVGAGCSGFRSTTTDASALPGPRTPKTPVMDADLKAYLKAAPSDTEMISLKFRLVDADGQLIRFTQYPSTNLGMTIHGDTLTPTITVRRGTHRLAAPSWIEITKEFIYPKAFNFPDIETTSVHERLPSPPLQPMVLADTASHSDGPRFPVTPTTPTAFAKKTTGYAIDTITVEPRAAFLLVQGRFVETLFDGFIDGAGEAFSPIVAPATSAFGRPTTVMLTENRVQQPTFTTRETPFIVSALPGKAYRVRLNVKEPGWFLEITAEPVQP